MQGNINDQTDLSAGDASQEETFLTGDLLKEQQQKATFRNYSFTIAWIFSGLFFVSVLTFSWGIMFCPNVFLLTKAIHSVEQGAIDQHPETKKTPTAQSTIQNIATAENTAEAENKKDQQGTLFNQFLIMIGLLAAIGTTLAIAVMRFSFSNEKNPDTENSATPISPIASSVAGLLSQVTDLIKNK